MAAKYLELNIVGSILSYQTQRDVNKNSNNTKENKAISLYLLVITCLPFSLYRISYIHLHFLLVAISQPLYLNKYDVQGPILHWMVLEDEGTDVEEDLIPAAI